VFGGFGLSFRCFMEGFLGSIASWLRGLGSIASWFLS